MKIPDRYKTSREILGAAVASGLTINVLGQLARRTGHTDKAGHVDPYPALVNSLAALAAGQLVRCYWRHQDRQVDDLLEQEGQ